MSKRAVATAAEAPRSGDPSPFPYADYAGAKRVLAEALGDGAFYGALLGASGMGKSSLLREVTDSLDRHRHQPIYLSSSRASITNVVRFLAQALRVPPRRSNLETIREISSALKTQPARPLICVDEADRLAAETLQEFRVIAECELQVEPLFGVLLSGLPSLTELLDAPVAFPLKRRITVRVTLNGLRRDELVPFLEHRFGHEARRVPTNALDELFERAQAAPALLDRVVRAALRRPGRLSADDVHDALDQAGL
jgi:type II secretory pathway predicted ATPase ExeA